MALRVSVEQCQQDPRLPKIFNSKAVEVRHVKGFLSAMCGSKGDHGSPTGQTHDA